MTSQKAVISSISLFIDCRIFYLLVYFNTVINETRDGENVCYYSHLFQINVRTTDGTTDVVSAGQGDVAFYPFLFEINSIHYKNLNSIKNYWISFDVGF